MVQGFRLQRNVGLTSPATGGSIALPLTPWLSDSVRQRLGATTPAKAGVVISGI
jgi:hypothetical protein